MCVCVCVCVLVGGGSCYKTIFLSPSQSRCSPPRYIWNQDGRPYRKVLDLHDLTRKKGTAWTVLNVAQQPGFILNSSVQQPLASILWENYFLIVSYLLMTPAMWITHAVESRHCAHVLGASFQSLTLQEMQQQRHKLNPTQRRTIFRTH